MLSFIYTVIDKIKTTFSFSKTSKVAPLKNTSVKSTLGTLKDDDFDFSTPVPKSDTKFWKGYSCVIGDLKCIIHRSTNLLLSYDGKLIGRYINKEFIPVEELDPRIIQWYKDCGFIEADEKV